MKRFLLHACCAPCAVYVIQELKERGFQVTAFFYNPNIYPEHEYKVRKDEMQKYCQENDIEFINHPASRPDFTPFRQDSSTRSKDSLDLSHLKRRGYQESHNEWLEKIKGLEKEPEGGKRCEVCYKIRLEKTAEYAVQNDYKYFDSTLSISPHKDYEKIKKIGEKLAKKYDIKFYGEDWKKQDGFKKSCALSHKHDFYRQDYCGCEYSHKNTESTESTESTFNKIK